MQASAGGPYLSIADRAGLRTNTFSVGLWVAPAAGNLAGTWLSKSGAYDLSTNAAGFAYLQVSNNVIISTTHPLQSGQWNHLFATYENRTVQLYQRRPASQRDYIGAAVSRSWC